MPTRKVKVASRVGLHARPASLFVQAVTATGLPVTIAKGDGDPVDARSILIQQSQDRAGDLARGNRAIRLQPALHQHVPQGRQRLHQALGRASLVALAEQQPRLHQVHALETDALERILDFTLHAQVEVPALPARACR